jgi:hypothetical protein
VFASVPVSPALQLLTGEFPPLPGQAQLGLQQSQNRVANPSVPLVAAVHGVPELPVLDVELALEVDVTFDVSPTSHDTT